MSLSHLTIPHLRKASRLIKKKESFLAKVKEIERELEALALYGVFPQAYHSIVEPNKRKVVRRKKRRAKISPAAVKPSK